MCREYRRGERFGWDEVMRMLRGYDEFRVALICGLLMILSGCAVLPGQGIIDEGRSGPKVITINEALLAELNEPDQALTLRELQASGPERYRIEVGDQIKITVWDHPELSSPGAGQSSLLGRQVRPDGKIFYPYAGSIDARGKNLEELRVEITTRLSHFFDKPQVDVNVLAHHGGGVTVSGAFKSTSPLQLTLNPLTLSEALGMAGVDAERADRTKLALHRDGKVYLLDMERAFHETDVFSSVYLRSGDHMHLPYNERNEVQVLGEVVSPRVVQLAGTLYLNQALGRAGGLAQGSARASHVYVLRALGTDGRAGIFRLDASSPAAFLLGARFPLKGGDVVFVAAAPVTRWNRLISQLLPSSNVWRNANTTRNQ